MCTCTMINCCVCAHGKQQESSCHYWYVIFIIAVTTVVVLYQVIQVICTKGSSMLIFGMKTCNSPVYVFMR